MPKQNVGVNVEVECKGGKTIITIDHTKEFGLSKSQKTITIASTKGNTKIQTEKGDEHVLGLNYYKYPG